MNNTVCRGLMAASLLFGISFFNGCVTTAQDSSAEDWTYLYQPGEDLSLWKATEHPESIRLEDGNIVLNGERAHLFYMGQDGDASWKNFEAVIEFMTAENANAGLFFHADWQESGWPRALECQINATHKDHRKTGSIYALGDTSEPGHEDDEWVTMRLRVVGQTATVWVNGKQINQWTQPEDHKLKKKRIREGTFALQAHDPGSVVKVRHLKVRRLPQ
ncbi:3-keto-disaccharide hydrolase [Coraliomargarita sinensis]|nr:DUF1080 domain-containing protein [Coraliomargarita sinensis]